MKIRREGLSWREEFGLCNIAIIRYGNAMKTTREGIFRSVELVSGDEPAWMESWSKDGEKKKYLVYRHTLNFGILELGKAERSVIMRGVVERVDVDWIDGKGLAFRLIGKSWLPTDIFMKHNDIVPTGTNRAQDNMLPQKTDSILNTLPVIPTLVSL